MGLIEKYQEELEEDLLINELNLNEKAYLLPALKHKWVARLINSKAKLLKVEKTKKNLKSSVLAKLREENINTSIFILDKSIDTNPDFKTKSLSLEEEIENIKLIISYLEKIENIFKTMTYDIKNIIDLTKLETT